MNQALAQLDRITLPNRRALQLVMVAVVLASCAFFLAWHDQARVLIMLCTTIFLVILWHVQRNAAVCLNFTYLMLLGDIRRIVNMLEPSGGVDPLLLVGPLFTLYVGLPLLPKVKAKDPLSRVMLVLLFVMLLEIVNPRQGSLLVGVSAGLFWIVPLMWFWIGRGYSTDRMCELLLYRVVLPLGFLNASLGLYQTFVGFLPWEKAWILQAQAAGLNSLGLGALGKAIRAFGFSVNGVEFVFSMMMSIVLIGAAFAAKRRAYILLLPVVGFAIFYASSRGGILKSIFGLAMVWAVRGYARNRATLLPRLLFALAIAVGAIGFGASQAADSLGNVDQIRYTSSNASTLATAHVVQGFSDPSSSTAGVHSTMFFNGILSGFTNPIGDGLGAVTLGGDKFGGTTGVTRNTEVDISDAFASMGLVGGICFVLMIFYTCRYTLQYFLKGPPILTFALVGIFASMLGSWIGMGQYSLAPTMCFCMGFVARKYILRQAELESMASGEAEEDATRGRSLPVT